VYVLFVAFLAGAAIGIIIGLVVGLRFGGVRAVRRIAATEYQKLLERADLD
jgi:hypothetical protein